MIVMNLLAYQNNGRKWDKLTSLCGNFITSVWNGLTFHTRLSTFLSTDMEDSTAQTDEELTRTPASEMVIARIPSCQNNEVKAVSTCQYIGQIPQGLNVQKYRNALQSLYVTIPDLLRDVQKVIGILYSKRCLEKAEVQRLRCAKQIEGEESQVTLLLDVLMMKPEETILKFIDILEEFNQVPLASQIKKTADEYESKQYHSSIMTRGEILKDRSLDIQPKLPQIAAIEQSRSEKSLDLILSSVNLPQTDHKDIQAFNGSFKHLRISLTTIYGNQSVLDNLQHAVYKLKPEFLKTFGVVCTCELAHAEQEMEQVGNCEALVSLGLVDGEQKAFEALESKMVQLENYIFKGTASIVSIMPGCIKIKIELKDQHHLQVLEQDIQSGALLYRITEWLKQQSYDSETTQEQAFMLTVDEDALMKMKLMFENDHLDTGDRLTFAVSYAYCPHEKLWFWSPDRSNWLDQQKRVVTAGIYQGKRIGTVDEAILEEIEKSLKEPSSLPDLCIPCAIKGIVQTPVMQQPKITPTQYEGPASVVDDVHEKSGIKMDAFSQLCNIIYPMEICDDDDDDDDDSLSNLIMTEMESIVKSMHMKEGKENPVQLKLFGWVVDGFPAKGFKENAECLFVSPYQKVGYKSDAMEEDNWVGVIANDDLMSRKLELQNTAEDKKGFLNSADIIDKFTKGITQVVNDKFESEKQLSGGLFYSYPSHQEYQGSQLNKEDQKCEYQSFYKIDGWLTCPLIPWPHREVPMHCSVAVAYQCVSWPMCAANWVYRKKMHGWPLSGFVDEVLNEGCYVIPTPVHGSQSWSFSFSIVEKKLLRTLPPRYRQALLILHKLGYKSKNLESHWKHALFWECELFGLHHTSVASVIFQVIDRMLKYLTLKEMPDYFVDMCNLFDEYQEHSMQHDLDILSSILTRPVEALSDESLAFRGPFLPGSKSLSSIFGEALTQQRDIEPCVTDMIKVLLQEGNDFGAWRQLQSSENPKKHLMVCPELWLATRAPLVPLKYDFIFSQFLVESFAQSPNIARYKARLGLLYMSNELHGSLTFHNTMTKAFSSQEAKRLLKEALKEGTTPDKDVQLAYAYYLYSQKEYEQAIGCSQDLIRKTLPIQELFLVRKECVGKELQNLSFNEHDIFLWHLAFGLYILVKSQQMVGNNVKAKEYLHWLEEATFKIPQTEGCTVEVHTTSLGLLGKAASDLQEYKLSSEAYRQKSEVQKLLGVTKQRNVSTWKALPSYAPTYPKFRGEGDPGSKESV